MEQYIVNVIIIIAVSAIAMLIISTRLKLLDLKTTLSITVSSLVAAFLLPALYHIFSGIHGNMDSDSSGLMKIIIMTAASYILVVAILSVVISRIIPVIGSKHRTEDGSAGSGDGPGEALNNSSSGDNYLEQIYDIFSGNNGEEVANNPENRDSVENNLEKSVDTVEIIDKMGIENNAHDSINMTIYECIDEAFRLKEQGDLEGSVINFMHALDKNPDRSLVFWIVIEICVLYRDLGQNELAYELLNSYYDAFGDIMDEAVRSEIENNLVARQF